MDIEQVVRFIEELYSPQPSEDVGRIQHELQVIQKSLDGIRLSNELLSNIAYSPNVKYFGALTLTVQWTTHVDSYESLWKIFKVNLLHLGKLSNQYVEDPLSVAPLLITIKKLMSNLSLIFTNINEQGSSEVSDNVVTHWNNPINTLILLFSHAAQLSCEGWQDSSQSDELIHHLINVPVSYNDLLQFIRRSKIHNKLALMFTEIIVEDLIKFQSKKTSMDKTYEVVHEHLYISTMALINDNLICGDTSDVLYSSIGAWINYISMARNVSPYGRMDLSEMFDNMIDRMCQSNEALDDFHQAEKIISIFANVFANDPIIMGHPQRERLEVIFLGVSRSGNAESSKHGWMLQYMYHLVTNEIYDDLKELAICVVDFLQVNTLDICNKLFTSISSSQARDGNLQQYVKVLLQLTNFPLVPVLQEFFSVRMVDFWLDLADCYSNTVPEAYTEQASQLAAEIFQEVVNIYLPKISLLNKQKVIEAENDDTAVHEFIDFRSAIADLMESLWSILGNDKLTNILITGIGENVFSGGEIGSIDVFEVEAMSFLLNTLLSDMNLTESPWVCDILDSCKFFTRNILMLFEMGCQSPADTILARTLKLDFVRTSSSLIGTLAGYFQQSSYRLNECIDALFQGLEKCTIVKLGAETQLNDKMEIMIIKTISILCDICRNELSSYLIQFFKVFNAIMKPESNVSTFTREKLTRSIGYIIESYMKKGPEKQANCILEVFNTIESYIQQVAITSGLSFEEQISYLHCMLSCISELGTAMIHPSELEEEALTQRITEFQNYWQLDPLKIRFKVLDLLRLVLSNPAFAQNMELVEVSCLILGKALDLPNEDPHFLRYSLNDIMEFLLKHKSSTNMKLALPYYVYLLEKLMKQYRDLLTSRDFDFLFESFFLNYYQSVIFYDPDLLQTTINFVNSVLDCKPSLVVHGMYWSSFLLPEFIKYLSAKERFTIVAATKFWCKVISNKKYSREDNELTNKKFISMGQEVIHELMFGLLNAQRSDLSIYTDLLRVIMAKFPLLSPKWLIAVLPAVANNNAAHEKFINKMSVTRGSRATSNVILEWWLSCNALPSL